MTLKKILFRLKSDKLSVFFYRTIFFIVRKSLEIEREARFFIIRRGRRRLIKEINGYKIELNLNDGGIARDLLLAGVREPRHTELMREAVSEGDVVLGIGANIGYYALLESRLAGPNGRIYALEPVSANYQNLLSNIKLNQFKNIETFNLAVGDKNGLTDIYLSKKSNWCSLKPSEHLAPTGRVERVDVITVDDLIKKIKKPDLIRMDVEGYEVEIVAGMKELIASRDSLKILVELHCFILLDYGLSLVENLVANGFVIKKLFRDCSPLMLGRDRRLKNFYYFLGKKINGIYEFSYDNVSLEDFKKKLNIFKEETVHVYFVRE